MSLRTPFLANFSFEPSLRKLNFEPTSSFFFFLKILEPLRIHCGGTDMSPSKLRVGAVRDKGTRPMHAFRTFLDDDDFSNLSDGVS